MLPRANESHQEASQIAELGGRDQKKSTPTAVFLSVVIPAYNEQHRIKSTLDSVTAYLGRQDYDWDLTVVDGESTDRTCEIVEEISRTDAHVNLLSCDTNRGKGNLVRHGMTNTVGKYRLFMDADNSTTIDHVEAFLPVLIEQEADIVIGSRRIRGAEIVIHQPWWKEALGDLGNRWIRFWAVPGIVDTQAGFKAFRGEVADAIFPSLTIDGWGFDVEVLGVARMLGYTVSEQPIRWNDAPGSKVRLRSYFEVLREVLKVRRNLKRGVYGSSD